MATTFVDYTGDGNATKAFSFPSLKEADVKVEVDGVVKTTSTHYNITGYTTTGGGNVVFTSGNIPANPAAIRIYRDTDVDTAKATYTAGSSVKAGDLNNNNKQLLFAAQEEQNQTVITSGIKDGAITTAKIKDSNVTTAKIENSAVTTGKIADNAVTMAKLAGGTLPTDITVASANIVDLSIASADIAADAVTNAKIADNSIDSEHYVDGSIDTAHIADSQITTAKLANTNVTDAKLSSDAVTTSKITDANVTTVKIADSNVTLAKLASDLKQTTVTNDDTKLPTSGAIVDYVALQLSTFGGFTAIADEVSFPNTQGQSGATISIADAAGVVVNASGVSTTGRTVGGSTVTINGIPSNFHSSTIASGVRLIVTSTGSGQIYNYHKATLPESDLVGLSGDINDFNERYRVGSSNPTSNNDSGDLFFNTSTGKMLVFNGTSSAFEEVQSIGNFFISTFAEAFNGSRIDFTLSNAPTSAQQILLSINGVIQKPNAGTARPTEGFSLNSSTVQLPTGSAPASGTDFFVIVMGSTVNIGTPSDDTVNTAKLTSGAVTTAKILNDAVTADKLASNAVVTASIVDDAVTADKLANSINSEIAANTAKTANATHSGEVTGATALTIADNVVDEANLKVSNSPTNGYFLSAQSGNTGGLTWAAVPNPDLTQLSASNLTSGTIPDARFPAVLPTADGSNLTGLASTTAGGAIYENSQTISTTHTIPSGSNGMSAGPVTVNNGITLTISTGSTYTIV